MQLKLVQLKSPIFEYLKAGRDKEFSHYKTKYRGIEPKCLVLLPPTRTTKVRFWSEAGWSPNHGVNGGGAH